MKNLIRIRFGIVFIGMGMGFILLGLSGCNDTGFTSREVSSTMSAAQLDSHAEDRSHDVSEDCNGASGNKVMICHVPPGNPAARHTICVGIRGAQNGHGINLSDPAAIGGHGGDTLGACGAVAAPEQPPSEQPPAPMPSGAPNPNQPPTPMPSGAPNPNQPPAPMPSGAPNPNQPPAPMPSGTPSGTPSPAPLDPSEL